MHIAVYYATKNEYMTVYNGRGWYIDKHLYDNVPKALLIAIEQLLSDGGGWSITYKDFSYLFTPPLAVYTFETHPELFL